MGLWLCIWKWSLRRGLPVQSIATRVGGLLVYGFGSWPLGLGLPGSMFSHLGR